MNSVFAKTQLIPSRSRGMCTRRGSSRESTIRPPKCMHCAPAIFRADKSALRKPERNGRSIIRSTKWFAVEVGAKYLLEWGLPNCASHRRARSSPTSRHRILHPDKYFVNCISRPPLVLLLTQSNSNSSSNGYRLFLSAIGIFKLDSRNARPDDKHLCGCINSNLGQ